jgi:hypothetical protein
VEGLERVTNDFSKLRALHATFGLEAPYGGDERLALAVLILDRDDSRGGAYRSQSGIAARAGLPLRSVQRALARLVQRTDGPLVVRVQAQGRVDGSGGRAPNLYTVHFRATVADNVGGVTRPPGAQPRGTCPPNGGGVVRQNRGDLSATLAEDWSSDRSSDRKRSVSTGETVPFALVSPPAKSSLLEGAHQQVVAHYHAAFAAKHGRQPIFDGADGKAVKRLLEKLKGDVKECCRRITIAFASYRSASVTIRDIASKPDAFASLEGGRVSRPRPIVQRGGTIRSDDASDYD